MTARDNDDGMENRLADLLSGPSTKAVDFLKKALGSVRGDGMRREIPLHPPTNSAPPTLLSSNDGWDPSTSPLNKRSPLDIQSYTMEGDSPEAVNYVWQRMLRSDPSDDRPYTERGYGGIVTGGEMKDVGGGRVIPVPPMPTGERAQLRYIRRDLQPIPPPTIINDDDEGGRFPPPIPPVDEVYGKNQNLPQTRLIVVDGRRYHVDSRGGVYPVISDAYPGDDEGELVYLAAERDVARQRLDAAMSLLGLREKLADTVNWQKGSSSSSSSSSSRSHDPLRVLAASSKGGSEKDFWELQKAKQEAMDKIGRSVVTLIGDDYKLRDGLTDEELKKTRGLAILADVMRVYADKIDALRRTDPDYNVKKQAIVDSVSAAISVGRAQGVVTDDDFKRKMAYLEPSYILGKGGPAALRELATTTAEEATVLVRGYGGTLLNPRKSGR